MPDEESGNTKPNDPDHNTLVESNLPRVPVEQEHERTPQNPHADCNKNKTRDIQEDIRSGERWLIGIGIASVFVNLMIANFYYGQLTQMRVATEASTKAANLAADTLDVSTGDFERTMRQLRYQTKAQVDSAAASKTSSETTRLELTKVQRAFISVSSRSEEHTSELQSLRQLVCR